MEATGNNLEIKTETKTVTRKIFYYYSDGSKIMDINGNHAVATQTADFTRTVTKNLSTGKTEYGKWPEAVFKEMPILTIEGYRANIASAPEVNVTPDNPPSDIDVYFTKDDKPFTGVLKNPAGQWVFYRDGEPDESFSGVAMSVNGNWIFINKGIYDTTFTGAAQSTRGNWLYVIRGRWNPLFTGITNKYNSKDKVYITRGRWNRSFSGKYKGYTIKNGVVVE